MTSEQLSDAARAAATARWGGKSSNKAKLGKATHVGILRIGEIELPCFVLADGTRVLSGRGLASTFGQRSTSQGASIAIAGEKRVPAFLSSNSLFPYVSDELLHLADSPMRFAVPQGGGVGLGYPAVILPEICKVILAARQGGALKAAQLPMANAAEVLLIALAKTGIVALVDEATGYQYDRARDELQKILDAYIAEELRPWTRRFSNLFFKEIYRIHGWKFEPGVTTGPRYIGRFINKYVYETLPKGVLEELRRKNPPENGQRRYKHFQFLTEDTGDVHLDGQILKVTTLLQVAQDKKHFDEIFSRVFPRTGQQLSLALPQAESMDEDDEDDKPS